MNQPAVAVHAYFRGRLIATRFVRRRPRGGCYRIGSSKRVDAPAAEALVGGREHSLLTVEKAGATLHVTAAMKGHLCIPGGVRVLGGRPDNDNSADDVALLEGSSAEIQCGAMTFRIAPTDAPPAVDVAPVWWRWQTQRYTLAMALVMAVVAGTIAFIPEDRKALSLDFIDANGRIDKILIRAPEIPTPPSEQKGAAGQNAGGAAPAAASSDPGAAGQPTARRAPRTPRLTGRGSSPRLDLAEGPTPVTLVSLIGRTQSATVRSIFTRGEALGADAEAVLGTLVGDPDPAWGPGGLGSHGTGARDAGQGLGLIGGGGPLATIGDRGPHGRDGRWNIGDRFPGSPRPGGGVPEFKQGTLTTRGGLDREIVRRIIRTHVNEVRFCYEQELPRHPSLSGRVVLQFAIAPAGQVVTAAVQESTLHLPPLETCMTQAVRRWSFPQPAGAGLTVVSYPFVLSPAGSS